MFIQPSVKKLTPLVFVLLFSLGLSACGGGGGSSDTDKNTPALPEATSLSPSVELNFPTQNRATTNNSVEVTGTAADEDSQVSKVMVNGIAATSENNFANWSVKLSLSTAINNLTISAEDTEGNKTERQYAIHLNPLSSVFSEPSELTLDKKNNQLIITDKIQGKLFKSNLLNPDLKAVNLNSDGDAIQLSSPSKTFWDQNVNEAMLLDVPAMSRSSSQSIYSINTETGSTTNKVNISNIPGIAKVIDIATSPKGDRLYILSDLENSRNGGVIKSHHLSSGATTTLTLTESHNDSGFSAPTSLTINSDGEQLFYLDNDALVSVDTDSGALSIISHRNGNLAIQNPRDLIVDSSLSKAWLTDAKLNAVIEISLIDGSRRIISDSTTGSGPLLQSPNNLVVDTDNARLLVADQSLNLVFTISLENGNREYFLSNRYGHGPQLETPSDVVIDASNNIAYLSDTHLKAILSVDLENGNRKFISHTTESDTLGSGTSFSEIRDLSVDSNSQRIWATDNNLGQIFEIDITNGNRTLLSQSYQTGSQVIQKPTGITFDEQSNALIVSDIFNDSAQKLSLSDYSVTMLGNKILKNGTTVEKPTALTFNADTNKIYAIDSVIKAIIEWDLTTGDSKVLSKLFTGQGINFSTPIDIQIDSAENKAYVTDAKLKAILSVDLTNGNRSVLSSNTLGSGPNFKSLHGLAFHAESKRLLATDLAQKALFSIDITNGNRTIISR